MDDWLNLLELDGKDLRRRPLEERKRELAKMLRKSGRALHFNEHIDELRDVVLRHACKLGLEGIVSKRKGSRYTSAARGSRASCRLSGSWPPFPGDHARSCRSKCGC
jgi:ATP-dependent DNA ligase